MASCNSWQYLGTILAKIFPRSCQDLTKISMEGRLGEVNSIESHQLPHLVYKIKKTINLDGEQPFLSLTIEVKPVRVFNDHFSLFT